MPTLPTGILIAVVAECNGKIFGASTTRSEIRAKAGQIFIKMLCNDSKTFKGFGLMCGQHSQQPPQNLAAEWKLITKGQISY